MYTYEEIKEAIERKYELQVNDWFDDDENVNTAMEDIDDYRGILDEDRYYPMCAIDDYVDTSNKSVLNILDEFDFTCFNADNNYFKDTIYGIVSTDSYSYKEDLGCSYCKTIIMDNLDYIGDDDLSDYEKERDDALDDLDDIDWEDRKAEELEEDLNRLICVHDLENYI